MILLMNPIYSELISDLIIQADMMSILQKERICVLDDSYREARFLAVKYIGISHKSSGKVRDYLIRKGIAEDAAADVVAGLILDGYIDDARIARSLILSRAGKKAEGKRMIQQRLYAAGISREAVLEADAVIPDDSVSISDLFDQKIVPEFKKMMELDSFDAESWMNKTMRFLLSKGYSSSLALDTLRKRIRDVE